MPRNGSGTYAPPSNSFNPAVSGTTISSSDWNTCLADLVAAITASIANDGQTATTAKLPFAFGIDISAATGGQINFPSTQNASAGANVLDDYAEGTFTPVFTAAGTPPTGVTYTTQIGSYTKIGRLVHAHVQVTLSSKGTGGVGAINFTGMPFTSASSANGGRGVAAVSSTNTTLTAGYTWLTAFMGSGSTICTLQENGSGVPNQSVNWSAAANDSAFFFSQRYHV